MDYRNNRSFSAYWRWQIAQLLPRTQAIPGPGETLGEYAVGLSQNDVLVVFALRRSLGATAQFASRASAAGTRVVYVTDQVSRTSLLRWQAAVPGQGTPESLAELRTESAPVIRGT